MRLEAQNDFLNKERLQLEQLVQKMKDEDKSKDALRKEISVLNDQKTKLKMKIEEYDEMVQDSLHTIETLKKSRENDLRMCNERDEKREYEIRQMLEKVEALEELSEQLNLEKNSLERQVEQAQQTISAYQSDKKSFSEVINAASSQKQEIIDRCTKLEEEKSEIKLELKRKTLELQNQQERLSSLENELRNSNKCAEDLRDTTEDIRRQLSLEKDKVSDLELRLLNQRQESEQHQRSYQSYQKMLKSLESNIAELREKEREAMNQLDGNNIEVTRLETTCKNLRTENDFLKNEIRMLQEAVSQSKDDVSRVEIKRKDILSELRSMEQRNELLTRDLQRNADLLQAHEDKYISATREKAETERRLLDLVGVKESLSHSSKKVEELQTKLLKLEGEKLNITGECEQLKARLNIIQTDLSNNEHSKSLEMSTRVAKEDEINQLKEQLFQKQILVKRHEEEIRILEGREREHERISKNSSEIEAKLSHTIEQNRGLLIDIDSLKRSVEQKENQIILLTKKHIEFEAKYKEDESQWRSAGNVASHLNDRLKQKDNALEEFRLRVDQRDQRIKYLEESLSQSDRDKRELEEKVELLVEKLRQMQDLVKSIERNRDELVGELQKGHDSNHTHNDSLRKLQNEITGYKKRLLELEEDLCATRESLEMISHERDEMQFELDEKTEQLVAVQKNYDEIYRQYAENKTTGVQQESKNQQYVYRIEQRMFI